MTATPQSELGTRLKTLSRAIGRGEIELDDGEAIRAFIRAYNPNDLTVSPPGDDSTLSTGTCNVYLARLTEAARYVTLTEAGVDAINGYLQSLADKGLAAWSVDNYSKALRRFYGFYESGPDPADISTVDTPRGGQFDPEDCLTRAEIHEMLDAAENPHDRAVFALLIFTGMRNTALRHIRVKDVDPQAGTSGKWRFNPNATDGLKGADKRGKWRPLLGAKGPVREWLGYHPTGDPDHYLITGQPRFGEPNPTTPVHGSTIRRVLSRLAEDTGNPEIQRKPTHPHMMRHTFVTVCKRDYDMDDGDVKWLMGHSPTSRVMETTYEHLSDGDYIERVEEAAGYGKADPESESPLTPMACDTCGEPLPPGAKACKCGHMYGPDAALRPPDVETMAETLRRLHKTNPELFPAPDAD